MPPDFRSGHPCAAYCQLGQANAAYARAQELLESARRLGGRNSEGEPMSIAKWCDQGNHAFSARDTRAEHWTRDMPGPDGGPRVAVDWDVCGPCLDKMAAMTASPAAAVPAALAGKPDD